MTIELTEKASAKILGLPEELYGPEYKELCRQWNEAYHAFKLAGKRVNDFEDAAYDRQEERQRQARGINLKQGAGV